jgi:hypothetical protein
LISKINDFMYAGYSEVIEIKGEEKRFCDVVDGGLDR